MTAEVKEVSAAIKELGDKIAGLTLLQAKELTDYLKNAYGIEPAAGGAVMMAAAPAAGGAAAAGGGDDAPATVSVIMSNAGQAKIQVIKVLRELTGLGLKEAKALADATNSKIKENISREEADKIVAALKEAGATVEIK